ncbi:MAG: NINE protein [Alphaproteobacteria bacterium]
MQNLESIEKLYELKEKGAISEEEFLQQKTKLLQQTNGGKNQLAYCLLAFFFGIFGIHNFYVGRWKRGLTQLLITLLTFFIGVIITHLWAIINIFTIHTDAKGNEFEICNPAKYILGILGILSYLWSVLVWGVSGVAGYTIAMDRYKARELENYSSQIAIMARVYERGEGLTRPFDCSSFDISTPEFFTGRCVVYPEGKVVFSDVDEAVKKSAIRGGIMQEDASGNLIFSLPF